MRGSARKKRGRSPGNGWEWGEGEVGSATLGVRPEQRGRCACLRLHKGLVLPQCVSLFFPLPSTNSETSRGKELFEANKQS